MKIYPLIILNFIFCFSLSAQTKQKEILVDIRNLLKDTVHCKIKEHKEYHNNGVLREESFSLFYKKADVFIELPIKETKKYDIKGRLRKHQIFNIGKSDTLTSYTSKGKIDYISFGVPNYYHSDSIIDFNQLPFVKRKFSLEMLKYSKMQYYWDNGNISNEYVYKNGKKSHTKRFDKNGKLIKAVFYEDGKKSKTIKP